MGFTFPEQCKIVNLYQGAANAVASDVVSMKNANKAWVCVIHTGSSDTDLAVSLAEHTAVGQSAVAITDTFPIWVDADMGTSSDALVRQTDAYSYTIDTGVSGNQMVVMEWDPAKFSAGYDCLSLADSGGNASNVVSAFVVLDMRYKADQPPAAITD
jgi:hypothetical protein